MTTSIVSQFLINTSHYQGGNTFKYKLPQGRYLKLTNNHSIAVSSCSIYNSSFNIRSAWGNNSIVIFSNKLNIGAIPTSATLKAGNSYTDPISGVTINKTYVQILIEDGYYDVPSLDAYFQHKCQLIGLYLQASDGSSNSYFFECVTAPQRYACLVNLFFLPAVLPSGYLLPSNACFNLGGSNETLQVYFPASNTDYKNLGNILGFKPDTILGENILVESQNLSSQTPMVSPITTYLISCNLVKNEYAIPDDLILQLSLSSSKFGGIIPYTDQPVYVTCQNQQTQTIVISLYDEYGNPLEIKDSQMSFVLSIKEDIQRPSK